MHKVIYNCVLTGVKMSQFSKVADQIEPGTELAIFNRPYNAYDSQAMSVHFGSTVADPQVGWIPNKEFEDKSAKSILSALVRNNVPLYGVVTACDPAAKTLSVNVCLLESPDIVRVSHDPGESTFS